MLAAARPLQHGFAGAACLVNRLSACVDPNALRCKNRSRCLTTVSSTSAPPYGTPNIPDLLRNVKPKLVINGELEDAANGKTFSVVDPRTEQSIIEVADGGVEDVHRAVKAARKAFDEGPWPRLSGRERGRMLQRFADMLSQHVDELASLVTLECGSTLTISYYGEIPRGIKFIQHCASWADKIHGRTIPVDGNYFAYTLHEPIGVVGHICPWNAPFLMPCHAIMAVAAGNTVVLKPAEQTPLAAIRLGEIALEAGIPAGVFNVVAGDGVAGATLVSHMEVDKIHFTGSTEVGQEILRNASGNLKRVSLELGGKSPLIVLPDTDLDKAVQLAHRATFLNQGQMCTAGSRLFVHAEIYDAFVERAHALAQTKVIGDPFTPVDQGPQVDDRQFAKILDCIDSGINQGAELICGGKRLGSEGYFIEQTIFANVKDDMRIAREEIFGPVQSILKFKDIDEVIRRANDTPYGLAAGILSNDINTIHKLSRSIRAGVVWVNCYHAYDMAVPFGGYKMSGIGREGADYGLRELTEVKTVMMPLEKSPWL